MKSLICFLSLTLVISGCVSYKAVGKFDDNSEILLGNVNHNLMAGGGKYEFTGVNTNINCAGIAARPDKYPFGLGCEGQEGNANGVCSDGKALTMRWIATSCTTGYGAGAKSDGNRFHFTFGLNKEEAMASLNKLLNDVEDASKKADSYKTDRAVDNCKKMGLKEKTEEFSKCVLDSSH